MYIKYYNIFPFYRKKPMLMFQFCQDLEKARAILEAKLAGREVDALASANPDVVTAMTLIADGYHSESEEDGEIDHDELKQSYIETKIMAIVAEGGISKVASRGVSPSAASHSVAAGEDHRRPAVKDYEKERTEYRKV